MVKIKENTSENSKTLKNPIEEYFTKIENSKESINSKSIFDAEDQKIELKTDLTIHEINLINGMKMNDNYLKSIGLNPIYNDFILSYERLKVSVDRKSRGEFVSVSKSNNTDDILQGMGNLSNIANAKK